MTPPVKHTRRELLKMTPLLGAAALFVPRSREWILRQGLGLSDVASEATFRSMHLAPTFSDREVTAFDQFPFNSYLTDDPGVDLDAWCLTVDGLVQRAGDYAIDAIKQLPKIVQNTRHVCVEGWD